MRRSGMRDRSPSATSRASRPRRACTCSPTPTSASGAVRRRCADAARGRRLPRARAPALSRRRAPDARAGGARRRVHAIAASSIARASWRFCAASTCCPCPPPTTSRKGCSCSRRWPAACPSSSRGAARSSRSSSGPAAACSSSPTIRERLADGLRRGSGAIATRRARWRDRAFDGVRAHYTIAQSADRLLDVYRRRCSARQAGRSVGRLSA